MSLNLRGPWLIQRDILTSMTELDRMEVPRQAHELAHRHGVNAHEYAAQLAAEALADGKAEECEFWKAVEACLKPRGK